MLLAGCGPLHQEYRYTGVCCQRGLSRRSIEEALTAKGFDAVGFGGSFGGTDISLRGPREDFFKAREILLQGVAAGSWDIGWLADHIILQDSWDQLGWEKGPWTRLAGVRHRVTPTPQALGL